MIRNKSKNKEIVGGVKLCKSVWSRAKGLMFSKKIVDKGLVFVFDKERRWGIHMLFVFFLIDVLWLDKDRKVVDFREGVRPFVISAKPKEKASYIIELPVGSVKKGGVEVGDEISF